MLKVSMSFPAHGLSTLVYVYLWLTTIVQILAGVMTPSAPTTTMTESLLTCQAQSGHFGSSGFPFMPWLTSSPGIDSGCKSPTFSLDR